MAEQKADAAVSLTKKPSGHAKHKQRRKVKEFCKGLKSEAEWESMRFVDKDYRKWFESRPTEVQQLMRTKPFWQRYEHVDTGLPLRLFGYIDDDEKRTVVARVFVPMQPDPTTGKRPEGYEFDIYNISVDKLRPIATWSKVHKQALVDSGIPERKRERFLHPGGWHDFARQQVDAGEAATAIAAAAAAQVPKSK
jgi:hypothetical protein